MQTKSVDFFESSIYIGSVRGYRGSQFSETELTRKIQDFQVQWNKRHDWTVAVRISKTNFVCMDYSESGWEITSIQYPRFPKSEGELIDFMVELRKFLLVEFRQNRITLLVNGKERWIELLEKENPEQNHKVQ